MKSKLNALAEGCQNGACNPHGIINSLAEAIKDVHFGSLKDHPALPVILGHLNFLCGEGIGPSYEAVERWEKFMEAEVSA